jgi:hypothetical protein
MRSSKLALSKSSSTGVVAGFGAMGSVAPSGFGGSSKSGSCQLKVGSPAGQIHGESGRKVSRFISPGASRVPCSASAGSGGKFNSRGLPQLTMGSTGRGVTSGPAKPGWFRGRAG